MINDFDGSNAYGQEGEALVRRYGSLMAAGETRCEVKHKSYDDLRFYVETEQKSFHGRGAWVPSGIEATDAELFAYVVADTGVVILLPTDPTRALAAQIGQRKSQPILHQGNPTRGYLVDLARFVRAARSWAEVRLF